MWPYSQSWWEWSEDHRYQSTFMFWSYNWGLYARNTVMVASSQNFRPDPCDNSSFMRECQNCSIGSKGCCGVQMAIQNAVFYSVKYNHCLHLCFTLVFPLFHELCSVLWWHPLCVVVSGPAADLLKTFSSDINSVV